MNLNELITTLPNYNPNDQAEGCWFDVESAEKAIYFVENYIYHVEDPVAGQPFILQNFQKAYVANLFGWKRTHPEFGEIRRYRESLFYVPRKNVKSTFSAAISLYCLCADGEKGAQVICAAADRNQAGLVFGLAQKMVDASPKLHGKIKCYKNALIHEKSGSSLKAISSEAYSKHGLNISCGIIDELHAQPNRELVDVLTSSRGARKQPLIIYLTTADYDKPSICNDIYKFAKNVCANKGDKTQIGYQPDFLPAIWEADQKDDWTKVETWKKANPNFGVSVHEDFLQSECKKAIEQPSFENPFKRLYLNLRTQNAVKALDLADYDKCKADTKPEGPCHAGLDLSSTTDVTSLVLKFANGYVLPFFWIPESNALARERRDKVPYSTWKQAGYLDMTPGNMVDYDFIIRRIVELSKKYNIQSIGYDNWNCSHIAQALQDTHGIKMFEYRQGFASMNEPSKKFEVLFKKHELNFAENPVMRWMCGNLMWDTQAPDNIKPSKEHSTEKIDGVVSLIMAIGREMLSTPFKSVYSERGVIFI